MLRLPALCGRAGSLLLGLLVGAASRAAPAQAVLVLQPGSTVGTVAGSGVDGRTVAGQATTVALGAPAGLAYDSTGALYIADTRNHQVTRVASGHLTVAAGNGGQGFSGDGGTAVSAELNAPSAVAVDAAGNLFIADTGNQRIRRVSASDGTIATIAGTGVAGFSGDGAAATAASLRTPAALASGADGALYIADTGNHRVRELLPDGTITTVAGNGTEGDAGDGDPALAASLDLPTGLAVLPDGRLLITDRGAHRVRVLNPDGTIAAYSLGGASAFRTPAGVAADSAGDVYLADAASQLVLQGSAGGASVAAGSGEQGRLQAGAPTATPMDTPAGVALAADGSVTVSDRHNHQVQRVQWPSLAFGSVPAGSTSATQRLTLRNGGPSALEVLTVDLPADFVRVDAGSSCGHVPFALQPDASCSVAIAFAPVAQGSHNGSARVRLTGAAPQYLLLSGTGTAGGVLAASLTTLHSDGSIVYAGAPVTLNAAVSGSLLAAPSGNVSFVDNDVALARVPLTGSTATFSTASLQSGAHTLRATYSGDAVYGTSTSPAVSVTVVPTPDFTLASSAASYSGKAGTSISVPIVVTPRNGTLDRVMQFSVSGLPAGAAPAFSPPTVTLGGNSAVVTLTAQMPATLARVRPSVPLTLPVLCSTFGLLFFLRGRKPGERLGVAAASLLALSGCGSGFRAGNTAADTPGPRTYPAVVTATTTGVLGNTLAHSASFSLVVSP